MPLLHDEILKYYKSVDRHVRRDYFTNTVKFKNDSLNIYTSLDAIQLSHLRKIQIKFNDGTKYVIRSKNVDIVSPDPFDHE